MGGNKYEILADVDPQHRIAKHQRLTRQVEIRRFAKGPQSDRIRHVASGLGNLDHPVIPHLVDYHEDESLELKSALFTDPSGVRIELTEGYDRY